MSTIRTSHKLYSLFPNQKCFLCHLEEKTFIQGNGAWSAFPIEESSCCEEAMADGAPRGSRVLIVAVRSGACALPLMHVIETMRPLPIEPMACALSFVRGISIIRGAPTPVVDLGALLGTSDG